MISHTLSEPIQTVTRIITSCRCSTNGVAPRPDRCLVGFRFSATSHRDPRSERPTAATRYAQIC
jgi:hypothetical protein